MQALLSAQVIMQTRSMNDSLDIDILMHRDAHFAGNFSLMLDYYRKRGKGVFEEFEISRIEKLAEEELRTGKNLSPLLLSSKDIEEIKHARDAYEALRKLYEVKTTKNRYPLLLADLILSEEEEAESEIQAIVQEKSAIVPYLIELIHSEDFYNPLFPGYGKAYKHAAKALGLIGDKRALIALFEAVGKGDFFDDEVVLNALKEIGQPAKEFLLRILHGKPHNEDNEKAAIALLAFKDDPQVAEACFSLLKELNFKTEDFLATYLILASSGLKDPFLRKEFEAFSKHPSIPKTLHNDFKTILEEWK